MITYFVFSLIFFALFVKKLIYKKQTNNQKNKILPSDHKQKQILKLNLKEMELEMELPSPVNLY